MVLLVVALGLTMSLPSEARRKSGGHKKSAHSAGRSHSSGRSSHSHGKSSRRGGKHVVAHHKGKHHKAHHHHHHVAHKPRYAYPVEMFMMKAPDFDASPLDDDHASEVSTAFARGIADKYPARTLVRAGVVKQHALRGGIYWRREPIKYIVMHSTETGIPVSGVRVIESWSSMGRRHPGAQYVVDRDGTIYQAVDPDLATVHINILKTLPGINNDNSVGIEMNHTGHQDYPEAQLQSVIRLVTYLQDRYQVQSENIITHRYAQQGDHTDPVHFDWKGFLWSKDRHRNQAIAYKMNTMEKQSGNWGNYTEAPPASVDNMPNTYLQPHPPAVVVPEQVIVQPSQPLQVDAPKPPASVVPVAPATPSGVVVPVAPVTPPATPSGTIVKPTTRLNDPNALPPLRGPIEVGPEQAGQLTAPKQP